MDSSLGLTQGLGDPSKLAEEWVEPAEQSMRAVQAFTEGHAKRQGFSILGAEGIRSAFLSMMMRLTSDPAKLAEAPLEPRHGRPHRPLGLELSRGAELCWSRQPGDGALAPIEVSPGAYALEPASV